MLTASIELCRPTEFVDSISKPNSPTIWPVEIARNSDSVSRNPVEMIRSPLTRDSLTHENSVEGLIFLYLAPVEVPLSRNRHPILVFGYEQEVLTCFAKCHVEISSIQSQGSQLTSFGRG